MTNREPKRDRAIQPRVRQKDLACGIYRIDQLLVQLVKPGVGPLPLGARGSTRR